MKYYLSLGSNLGDRRRNLARALVALAAAGVRAARVSAVYRTEPVGFAARRWFYNLAVEARSSQTPSEMLRLAKRIETELGRAPGPRNAPRPIDIDILLAGRRVVKTRGLVVPHPRLEKRNFVLVPLAEIAPSALHPVLRRRVSTLLAASADRSAVRRLRPLAALRAGARRR